MFQLENRTGDRHNVSWRLAGLPMGDYTLIRDDQAVAKFQIEDAEWHSLSVPLPISGAQIEILQGV